MKENQISIKDENGKEKLLNILFTFSHDNNDYVLCFDEKDPDIIMPFKYDSNNNLYIVEDKDELDKIAECLEDYDRENIDEEIN